ncbi:MAG: ABC transporter ATP-binding protein [Treponema sp.]|jgi:iron complex transport system ATP-binding protein|nr:ABC transporter ATP-binding protein [Treponema sp.]
MLELREIFCGYGTTDVLKGINLKVEPGEFLCIVGSNGCGKSTLLKAIARLLPFRGSITIDGREISAFSQKDLARHIALMGQVSPLYFPYTVYDTVAMGRYAYRKGWFGSLDSADKAAIENALKTLTLDDLRDELISELSGGQLQRIFLARTLVQDPRIILLDEPTNHLDIENQTKLMDYLTAWVKSGERIIIAVFHDLNLARRYGTAGALVNDGIISALGQSTEVFSCP